MKNLKIVYKFALSLGMILVLMLFACYSAITTSITLEQRSTEYKEKINTSLDYITFMRDYLDEGLYTVVPKATSGSIASAETSVIAAEEFIDNAVELVAGGTIDVMGETYANNNDDLEKTVQNLSVVLSQLKVAATSRDYEEYNDIFANEYLKEFGNVALILDEIEADLREDGSAMLDATIQRSNSSTIALSVIAGISIIATVFISIILTRTFTVPIKKICDAMQAVARGEMESASLDIQGKDEFAQLAKDIMTGIEDTNTIVEDLSRRLSELADGDFTLSNDNDSIYVGEYAKINESFHEFVNKMNSTLIQVNNASEQVASASQQVALGAQSLAEGSTQQSFSLQELAESIGDVSEKINDNAKLSKQGADMSVTSAEYVDTSNQQMKLLMKSMEEIDSKSKEISKIIKAIEDIAFQTNILALNAAVEAARAGNAGKGFAVVADEVRNLAAKSAEAAQNTTSLIEASITAINNGVELANKTASNLDDVVEKAKETNGLIENISVATASQSEAINSITGGLDHIAGIVHINSATSEESAAASEELSSQAAFLKSLVSTFKLTNYNTYIAEDIGRDIPVKTLPSNNKFLTSHDDKY